MRQNSETKSDVDPTTFDPGDTLNVGNVSMATVLGAASGFAAKRVAKGAGLALGVGFIGLQGLAQTGLIKINWPKIEGMFHSNLDLNNDGKVDSADLKIGAMKFVNSLTTVSFY